MTRQTIRRTVDLPNARQLLLVRRVPVGRWRPCCYAVILTQGQTREELGVAKGPISAWCLLTAARAALT